MRIDKEFVVSTSRNTVKAFYTVKIELDFEQSILTVHELTGEEVGNALDAAVTAITESLQRYASQ
jgi:hypothetical protein